jgi:hypothetical protein
MVVTPVKPSMPCARNGGAVGPNAGSAASHSSVQFCRLLSACGSRGRRCLAEHAARRRSCAVADGTRGSSALVDYTLLTEVDLAVATPLRAGQPELLHGRVVELLSSAGPDRSRTVCLTARQELSRPRVGLASPTIQIHTTAMLGAARRAHVISTVLFELEAERRSLDSRSLSDELSHEVCTAMMRTHRCGLDRASRAKLAALFIQIFTGIQTARIERCRCSLLTSVAAL